MTPAADAPVRSDSFRPVLGATVLLVFAFLAIAALKSSRDLEAARARERLLEARIADTRGKSERLRVRIERLRHDPGMLERLAREDLGMVRPGDVIIELPSPDPPAVPVRAAAPPHLPGPPLPEGEEGANQESPAVGPAVTPPPSAPPPSPPAPE